MARRNKEKVIKIAPGPSRESARAEPNRLNTQPSIRVSTTWNPQKIKAVQLNADSGNLMQVSDLVDQMLADDCIGPTLTSLAEQVLGAEVAFQAALHKKQKGEAPLAAELEDDWWEGFTESEYTQIIIWRELLGVAFSRTSWTQSETSPRLVPRQTFWHPRSFRYDNQKQTWLVKLANNVEEPIAHGDGEWVIWYRRGAARPWASGLWRGLSRWWMLKALAISDWGVHSSKAARSVITAGDQATMADRKQLAIDLFNAEKDGIISLPPGFTYTLVEATANTRDIYDAQISASNMAMTVAIKSQNLTTEISENGARAAGEVHERQESSRVRFIAESLSTTARDGFLFKWAEFNFGTGKPSPWIVFQVSPPENIGALATTLSTLATALGGLKTAGYELDEQELQERFKFKLTKLPEPEPLPEEEPEPEPGNEPPPRGVPKLGLDEPRGAGGFVRGQLYADDIADEAKRLTAAELKDFVARVLDAVEGANDYESVRKAVLQVFAAEEEPERLADIVEAALVMSHLGGRLGAHEDAT